MSLVFLRATKILRDLCRRPLGWDDVIPQAEAQEWTSWLEELCHLERCNIMRCLNALDFGEVTAAQLHHFCKTHSWISADISFGRACRTICFHPTLSPSETAMLWDTSLNYILNQSNCERNLLFSMCDWMRHQKSLISDLTLISAPMLLLTKHT